MENRDLLKALADGEFHSGERLGRQLSVSRAAVWKQIESLRELGLDIHSVSGRGYRLPGGLDLLDAGRLGDAMGAARSLFGAQFSVRFSVDSTNLEAMRAVQQGVERCVIVAEHQSNGRGRRGRQWVSPFGHNIYLSMVWPFQGGVAALEGLSLTCALAVDKVLSDAGLEGVQLKWPNDVLCDGRKLAGILLEVQGDMSDVCRVVIGIGLNTDMPVAAATAIDQPYSDLTTVTGKRVDRSVIAGRLIGQLVENMDCFEREGFAAFQAQWMARDMYIGHEVEVRTGRKCISGVVRGVDAGGRLQLEALEEGGLVTVAGGEVFPSLRPVAAGKAGPEKRESA